MIPYARITSTADLTRTTLQWMARLITLRCDGPELVEFARDIVSGATGPVEEAEAVRSWVHQNITYRRDPVTTQYLQDPLHTLKIRSGNCDCQATLCGTLLAALGHEVTPLGVLWQGQTQASHAVLRDDTADSVIVDSMAPKPIPAWPPRGMTVAGFVEVAGGIFQTLPSFAPNLQGFLGRLEVDSEAGGLPTRAPGVAIPSQPITIQPLQPLPPGPVQPLEPLPRPTGGSGSKTIQTTQPTADAGGMTMPSGPATATPGGLGAMVVSGDPGGPTDPQAMPGNSTSDQPSALATVLPTWLKWTVGGTLLFLLLGRRA